MLLNTLGERMLKEMPWGLGLSEEAFCRTRVGTGVVLQAGNPRG